MTDTDHAGHWVGRRDMGRNKSRSALTIESTKSEADQKAGLTTRRDCRLPMRRRPSSQRPPPRSKDSPAHRRVMIPSVLLAKRRSA